MDLISLVVVLIVVGVLLWLDATIKQIINVVVIIAVVLWLLNLFVGIPNIRVGR